MSEKPYKPTKKELERWAYINSLPISVRYPIRRKAAVDRCLRLRLLIAYPARIALGLGVENVQFALKREQMMLVKLRIWRATGNYPVEN
jgi:hypothetical protein